MKAKMSYCCAMSTANSMIALSTVKSRKLDHGCLAMICTSALGPAEFTAHPINKERGRLASALFRNR